VHPFIDAYIKKGIISMYRKWQMRYGFGIRVVPDQKLSYLEYHFYDKNGNEVDMKEATDMK
jgi:ribonuclease G